MTPQLFINYKLKSVAHLPWRMLTYKALNTFIDDIFAFVIKMPTLYRIGCLRDGECCFFSVLFYHYNIGIKHGFSYINICQVTREVLKTESRGHGFQTS